MWCSTTSERAEGIIMSSEKPFISIKVNGSYLYELNLEDLKKLQDEIQNYIDDIETNEGEDNNG